MDLATVTAMLALETPACEDMIMRQKTSKAIAIAIPATGVTGTGTTHDSIAARVLRDTYRLLAMTLAFSAVVAAVSAGLRLPHPGLLLTLGGYFGLLFLTSYLRNSAWGLLAVFGLTGFMGYTLGPLIATYLAMPGGTDVVTTALGATAVVFVGLSWYARRDSAPDMSRYGSFLMVGILTAFCLGLAAYFFAMPALSLAVSAMFVLLMSASCIWISNTRSPGLISAPVPPARRAPRVTDPLPAVGDPLPTQ